MAITVRMFPCLDDNYGFLVRDEASGHVAAIDTPEAGPIAAEVDRLGGRLDLILNTHWHRDHAGGNAELKARYGAGIVAPAEVTKTSAIDRPVDDGDVVMLGETRFDVLATGGHTLGHVSYHAAADRVVFVGDTLFALGCGRMFEGTPEQMWASLSRLAALPDDTLVYCAHEYTLSNLRFALSVDDDPVLRARAPLIEAARAAGRPTVPTTIAAERATNPFLRAPVLPMARTAADPATAFAMVRQAKDDFRG